MWFGTHQMGKARYYRTIRGINKDLPIDCRGKVKKEIVEQTEKEACGRNLLNEPRRRSGRHVSIRDPKDLFLVQYFFNSVISFRFLLSLLFSIFMGSEITQMFRRCLRSFVFMLSKALRKCQNLHDLGICSENCLLKYRYFSL